MWIVFASRIEIGKLQFGKLTIPCDQVRFSKVHLHEKQSNKRHTKPTEIISTFVIRLKYESKPDLKCPSACVTSAQVLEIESKFDNWYF